MLTLPALPAPDIVTRTAIVEGYNSNTYQAQDDPNVPVLRRHPSPFTGVDANLQLRYLGRDADRTTIILDARANHYEPLTPQDQSDDGAVNLGDASHVTLAPRTSLTLTDTGSVTSFNAAHVTDGTIFAFDPTQIRSTYWLDDVNASLLYELSPKWRITQSIGATVSGTLHAAPTLLPGGQLVEHRGLDYVMPYEETDLYKDFTWRSAGDMVLLYQYSYQLYVLDFTQNPPRNIGPDKQAFLTGLAGWTYHWNQEVVTVVRAGGVLASAPPRDIDQRPILSPATMGEFYYTRPEFSVVASGGYTWGTVNPRLGAGPTGTASLLVTGVPKTQGKWQNFALIGSGQFSYSSLITGVGQSTTIGIYAAGIEARYALGNWLGLLGGYDVRYATFTGPTFNPPFLQHVVFFGVSGYWSTDRTVPALTTYAAPVVPPS